MGRSSSATASFTAPTEVRRVGAPSGAMVCAPTLTSVRPQQEPRSVAVRAQSYCVSRVFGT